VKDLTWSTTQVAAFAIDKICHLLAAVHVVKALEEDHVCGMSGVRCCVWVNRNLI